MPHTSDLPVAPEQLLDIISCSCRAEGKACRQSSCSCKSAGLSCTDYCVCEAGDNCLNPLTIRDNEEEDLEEEGDEEDEEEGE